MAAVFGAPPRVYEGHASRAAVSGIQLQSQLYSLNIPFKIGISSGNVDYGTIGNKLRRAYAFSGMIISQCYQAALLTRNSCVVCTSSCRNLIETAPQRLGEHLALHPLTEIVNIDQEPVVLNI